MRMKITQMCSVIFCLCLAAENPHLPMLLQKDFYARSAKEVQEMIRNDIEKHPQFVISGVTMNWDEDILSLIDVAFILEVPAEERVKRLQHREEVRFGSRVMSGGDMYEQQKTFREIRPDQ